MCKKKPGPRCAAHTRKDRAKAWQRYEASPTDANYEHFVDAAREYNTTPTGIKEVQEGQEVVIDGVLVARDGVVVAPPGVGKRLWDDKEEELEHLKETRITQVRAYKEMERQQQETERQAALDDYLHEFQGEVEDDEEGYSPLTGANAAGWTREGKHIETGTDRDPQGRDIEGFYEGGYDDLGVDRQGFNEAGYNIYTNTFTDFDGYNRRGFNPRTGLHRNGTRYDENGENIRGVGKDGWRASGWNEDYTRHRDTVGTPYENTPYGPDGYDITGVDAGGYHRDGTNRRGFYRDGINKITGEKWDGRGFDIAGLHKETKSYFAPDGYNRDDFDAQGYHRTGFLHPDLVEEGREPLSAIRSHRGGGNYLARHGLTERNGYYTTNARGKRLFLPVVVTGYRYRKQPARMLFEITKLVIKHERDKHKERTLYQVSTPHSDFARTFGSRQEMKNWVNRNAQVSGKPQHIDIAQYLSREALKGIEKMRSGINREVERMSRLRK